MLFRVRFLPAIVAVLIVAGCGSDPRITSGDKTKIADAGLAISLQCMSGTADTSKVEDAVTELLNARDKFGDQRFTISDAFKDVTVQDIIDRQAGVMRDDGCVPEQAKRLE